MYKVASIHTSNLSGIAIQDVITCLVHGKLGRGENLYWKRVAYMYMYSKHRHFCETFIFNISINTENSTKWSVFYQQLRLRKATSIRVNVTFLWQNRQYLQCRLCKYHFMACMVGYSGQMTKDISIFLTFTYIYLQNSSTTGICSIHLQIQTECTSFHTYRIYSWYFTNVRDFLTFCVNPIKSEFSLKLRKGNKM
jgi:hypothetical protein